MPRRAWVLLGVVVVLAGGGLLAAFLAAESRERDAIADLLRAQQRGDRAAVDRQVRHCAGDCAFLDRVAGSGEPKIARLDSGTSYSFGTAEGWSRVVWLPTPEAEPVVQCVWVRREGVLTGRSITLERLSAPLADNEGSC